MAGGPGKSRSEETNLVEVASYLFLLAVVLGVVLPSYGRMKYLRDQRAYLSRCRTNLLTLHEQVERYAREHDGLYPPTLDDLVGDDFRSLPTCPAAGEVTYRDRGYEVRLSGVPRYTIRCFGNNHLDVGMNLNEPFYSSVFGLGPISAPTEEWKRLQACKANLERIGAALGAYVKEKGSAPARLEELVEMGELDAIPTCPSAGRPTYIEGYSRDGAAYTVRCQGENHADAGKKPGEPYFSSHLGLSI